MNRSRLVVLTLFSFALGCNERSGNEEEPKTATKPTKPKLSQELEELKKASNPMNDPYARPPGGGVSKVVDMNRKAPPPTGHPGSGEPTTPPGIQRTSNGWQIYFSSGPVPTPAVHQGKLIVSGGFNSHNMFAYNATTGAGVWGVTVSDDGPSNPVCEGETCVFNSESCTTFAVNAKTGRVLWSWWLGDPQTSSPTIANGMVFASYPQAAWGPNSTGGTHTIAAFDLKSGKPLWRRWLDGDVMSSPVAVGDFVYMTTFAGTVMKLDQKTGDIRYAIAMRATSAPVVVRTADRESLHVTRRVEERPEETKEAIVRADLGDTRLKFRSQSKTAPYLDPNVQRGTAMAKAGAIQDSLNGFGTVPTTAGANNAMGIVGIANVSTMQRFQGSRALIAGNTVYSTMGDEVVAVDSEDGLRKWRYGLPGNLKTAGGHLGTAPLIAGGEIVIATFVGEVIRLDAKTGKLVASYNTGAPLRSQPVVEGGWIYLGTEDGRLIAIDTGARTLTGWPTWGGDNGRTAVRL